MLKQSKAGKNPEMKRQSFVIWWLKSRKYRYFWYSTIDKSDWAGLKLYFAINKCEYLPNKHLPLQKKKNLIISKDLQEKGRRKQYSTFVYCLLRQLYFLMWKKLVNECKLCDPFAKAWSFVGQRARLKMLLVLALV